MYLKLSLALTVLVAKSGVFYYSVLIVSENWYSVHILIVLCVLIVSISWFMPKAKDSVRHLRHHVLNIVIAS